MAMKLLCIGLLLAVTLLSAEARRGKHHGYEVGKINRRGKHHGHEQHNIFCESSNDPLPENPKNVGRLRRKICGSDAVTYNSFRAFRKAKHCRHVSLVHLGECDICNQENICKNFGGIRNIRTHLTHQVYDTYGNTYENKCEFLMQKCEQFKGNRTILLMKKIKVLDETRRSNHRTFCESVDHVAPENATKHEICGSDAKTYNNSREFRKAKHCDNVSFVHIGACDSCTKASICKNISTTARKHQNKMKKGRKIIHKIKKKAETLANRMANKISKKINLVKKLVNKMTRKLKINLSKKLTRKLKNQWHKHRKLSRNICDTEGNTYEDKCEFMMERCERFKENRTVLLMKRKEDCPVTTQD